MSLVRWGTDGSDVYVYESCYGGLECCACPLTGDSINTGDDPEKMALHLEEHREAGHTVPQWVIDGLRGIQEPEEQWVARLERALWRTGSPILAYLKGKRL